MGGTKYKWQYRQAQIYRLLRGRLMTSRDIAAELGMKQDATIHVLRRGKLKGIFEPVGRTSATKWRLAEGAKFPRYAYNRVSLENLVWGHPWAALRKIHGRTVAPRPVPATELERTWGWGA